MSYCPHCHVHEDRDTLACLNIAAVVFQWMEDGTRCGALLKSDLLLPWFPCCVSFCFAAAPGLRTWTRTTPPSTRRCVIRATGARAVFRRLLLTVMPQLRLLVQPVPPWTSPWLPEPAQRVVRQGLDSHPSRHLLRGMDIIPIKNLEYVPVLLAVCLLFDGALLALSEIILSYFPVPYLDVCHCTRHIV